jgi:hypothetical protein
LALSGPQTGAERVSLGFRADVGTGIGIEISIGISISISIGIGN